ncbi:DUF4097 family beta strand repeat-containing protein [Bacillus xiapuensis]|uniref:DUF4097 family beta strand repeat-containing protein n=1 Tax=Bacillus xiapuensis TaxID=2014075 RepID=UPI000C24FF8A|nr:DUF4097 domain-containing protein [Bacillus xiapuensis]
MNEEKKRILEMVEAGVISASEAVTLLEALEKQPKPGVQRERRDSFLDELVRLGQKFSSQKQWQSSESAGSQPKDKLFQFIQSTVQRLKDFEFPLGKAVEFSHVFEEKAFSPARIKAEIANGNFVMKPWKEDGVKAECQVKVYGADQEDEARESFIKNSVFYARDHKLSFSVGLKLMKVDTVLYVPEEAIGEVSVKLFNGSFRVEDAIMQELDVKTANGQIEVRSSRLEDFEGETGNGPIYFIDCQSKKAAANSFNGAIHVVGSVGYTDIQSFNGNILCDIKSQAAHTVKAQAVTGNIEVYVPENMAMKGELRTNLGSLQLPEQGMKKVTEKEETVQKFVHFESEREALERVTIEAGTKTGSIAVKTSAVPDETSEEPPEVLE